MFMKCSCCFYKIRLITFILFQIWVLDNLFLCNRIKLMVMFSIREKLNSCFEPAATDIFLSCVVKEIKLTFTDVHQLEDPGYIFHPYR